MDKCSKKDCVDFDVSKEDMDLTGNCNVCRNNGQCPNWPSQGDQYLKMEGNVANPTDDVVPLSDMINPHQTGAYPIFPQTEEDFANVDIPTTIGDKIKDALADPPVPPVYFTPIPVMEDRREKTEEFLALTSDPAHCTLESIVDDFSMGRPVDKKPRTKAIQSQCLAKVDADNAVKEIKDSGKRTEFSTGAVRDAQGGKGRFDLIPNMAVWALAHHTEKGCKKYGDRNWEKGIPIKNFIDSAKRHLTEFELGLTDENHLAAALWNVACCYETMLRIDMGILPKSLDEDLAYPLRGVIQHGEMVMPWDRLRYPRVEVPAKTPHFPFPWGKDGNPTKEEVLDSV